MNEDVPIPLEDVPLEDCVFLLFGLIRPKMVNLLLCQRHTHILIIKTLLFNELK